MLAAFQTARPLYRAALIWNLLWGAPLLFSPSFAAGLFGIPPPGDALGEMAARGAGFAVVMFGFIYVLAGKQRDSDTALLAISVAIKFGFVLLGMLMILKHTILWPMGLAFAGDLAFGLMFLRDLQSARRTDGA